MSYSFHHHYEKRTVLKKNFDIEYNQLIDQYGKENIELEKELILAYHYKCWINEAKGEWVFDPLIKEYVYISETID